MSDTATLETPAQEAPAAEARVEAVEAAPRVAGEPPVAEAPPAQAEPAAADASMNWPEQKPAEPLKDDEYYEEDVEPIGSAGARHIGDPPDLEMWKLIKSARDEEKAAEEEVDELSAELKDAKRRHEAASLRLGKLIDEGEYPNLYTGIKAKPEPVKNTKATEAGTPGEGSNPGEIIPNPIQDDSWRAVPLADLGIKEKTLAILAAHTPSLTTLGEFCDWQQKKGDFWAADIKGVGPTKRQEIEDASFAYFQKHPQPAAAAPISKAPDMPGDLPSAPPGSVAVKTERVTVEVMPLTLADLGLTTEQIQAAYYPALLKQSKGDKPVECADVLRPTLEGGKTLVNWIAVPGPVGGADVMLVPLIPTDQSDTISLAQSDRYGGIIVTHKGEKFYLGGVSQSLFISSPKAQGESDAKLTRAEAKAAKMHNALA